MRALFGKTWINRQHGRQQHYRKHRQISPQHRNAYGSSGEKQASGEQACQDCPVNEGTKYATWSSHLFKSET